MFNDINYMRRCLQLARCGEAGAQPNPVVGAVIVCDSRIIGEGYHRRCGGPHAEANAINSPCADLIIETGIRRVVIGCTDPFAKVNGLGIKKLREAGCEVQVGVLEQECRELNRRFFTFHEKHRPWITLKWAQSSDGIMGGDNRITFSNALTQTLVHRLRARSGAILVGTNTALQDNPTLTTRLWPGPNPLRLTIDRNGILPPTLHLKDNSTPTVIYSHESIEEILADLYARGIQSLLVEGGAKLLQSFIDKGLWDEARIETAPLCLGQGTKAPTLKDEQLKSKQNIDGHIIQHYCHKP